VIYYDYAGPSSPCMLVRFWTVWDTWDALFGLN
jgi:hypothetical protein